MRAPAKPDFRSHAACAAFRRGVRRDLQAALDDVKEDDKGVTQVRVEVEKKEFVLCTLRPGKVDHATLNVFFSEGERVTFRVTGNQYGQTSLEGHSPRQTLTRPLRVARWAGATAAACT